MYCEQLPDRANAVSLAPAREGLLRQPRAAHPLRAWARTSGGPSTRPRTVASRILTAMGLSQIRSTGLAYAGHQIGTHRMGTDPRTSVVDVEPEGHDVPNLYLVGSGCFVTASASPPTLTIAALAIRAAEHIAARAPDRVSEVARSQAGRFAGRRDRSQPVSRHDAEPCALTSAASERRPKRRLATTRTGLVQRSKLLEDGQSALEEPRAPARSPAARSQLAWATRALASSFRAPTSSRSPHRRLEVRCGGRRILGGQDLAEQPLGHPLEVPVTRFAAGRQDLRHEQRARGPARPGGGSPRPARAPRTSG